MSLIFFCNLIYSNWLLLIVLLNHVGVIIFSQSAIAPIVSINLPPGKLDFVISVSSKQPSLTPVLLLELLKNSAIKVATSYHIHSSYNQNIPDEIFNIIKDGSVSRTEAQVVFTFIWKQGREQIYSNNKRDFSMLTSVYII